MLDTLAPPPTRKQPRRLICACCGGSAIGRQWWNRDHGYGLCAGCVAFVSARETPQAMHSAYGERGVHYDVAADTVPKHLRETS